VIEGVRLVAERGRPSASSGNAYHDVRVALCLIDLLEDSSIVSIAVEALNETDDLVVKHSEGSVRYEQVKERAPRGRWTPTLLVSEGILRQFIAQHQADPSGELVLFTASDASDFREVAERARNACANHPADQVGLQAAHAEWEARLAGHRPFIDRMLMRVAKDAPFQDVTRQGLFQVLAHVLVRDASGAVEQLRERAVQRLRLLVDDPHRALQTLEGLARDAAIRRGVIDRRHVEAALEHDGSGPRFNVFALAIDPDAYAQKIASESTAVDVAKLVALEPNLDLPSGLSYALDTIRGKAVLIGGHGAGKSRIAADLAVKAIQSGRRCLHIRLARWATTLRDLLVAELSLASNRHARAADLDRLFEGPGALVLDGLDEVPATHTPPLGPFRHVSSRFRAPPV
jgi:hypothetical protein